jgi:uncharacterized sulfatase
MRWPARIRPGRVVAEPVSTLDLLPTLVALAGASLPRLPLDGQDVSRLLTGQVERIGGRGIDGGRELVFFGPEGAAAIRSGRFKYMRPGFWNTQPSLYDLDADPGERNDLRASRPDLVKQLDARIDDVIAGR